MSKMKSVYVDVTLRVKMRVPSELDEEDLQEVISELEVSMEDHSDTIVVSESEVLESSLVGNDDEDFQEDKDE